MPEQRNLILAIVLSVTIIIAFQYFYELPRLKEAQRQQAQRTEQMAETAPAEAAPGSRRRRRRPERRAATEVARTQALATTERVAIENAAPRGLARADRRADRQSGALGLSRDHGAGLAQRAAAQPAGRTGHLLRRVRLGRRRRGHGGARPRRHMAGGPRRAPPGPAGHAHLGQRREALRFSRTVAIDENYMFTITQRVENTGDAPVTLHPYGLISRWGTPPTLGFFILHEGPIGVLAGTLEEIDYDDLREDGPIELPSQGGWLGITDKYWLTALVPDQDKRAGRELSPLPRGRPGPLPGRLPAPGHDRGAGRDRRGYRPSVRRRQGGRAARRLRQRVRHPAVRSRGRLRLVLLPDQADLPHARTSSTSCSATTAWRSCC